MTQVDWMTCAGHTEQLKCHLVFAWYQATTFSSLDMMNFMKTQKLEGLLLISKFSWKWTKFKQSLNVSMHLKAGQRQKLCFLKELGLCISVKKFLKL